MPWEGDLIHLSRESDGGIAVELPEYELGSTFVEMPPSHTVSGSVEGDALEEIKSRLRRLLAAIRRAVIRLARRVKGLRYRYVAPISRAILRLGVTEPVSITPEFAAMARTLSGSTVPAST